MASRWGQVYRTKCGVQPRVSDGVLRLPLDCLRGTKSLHGWLSVDDGRGCMNPSALRLLRPSSPAPIRTWFSPQSDTPDEHCSTCLLLYHPTWGHLRHGHTCALGNLPAGSLRWLTDWGDWTFVQRFHHETQYPLSRQWWPWPAVKLAGSSLVLALAAMSAGSRTASVYADMAHGCLQNVCR